MNCRSTENYFADLDMEKGLREIITVKGKETIPPKNYDEIVKRLCFALSFFGEYGREALREKEFSIKLGGQSRRFGGKFFCWENEIVILNVLESIKFKSGGCSPSSFGRGSIEDVFVHEFAHFLDHQKGQSHKYFRNISSVRSSKERQIADAFLAKMIWEEKPSRSTYAGKTCELFARAIAEYWGIMYGTEDAYIRVHSDEYYKSISKDRVYHKTGDEYANHRSDSRLDCYYIERDVFLKHIAPLVSDYMNDLQGGPMS